MADFNQNCSGVYYMNKKEANISMAFSKDPICYHHFDQGMYCSFFFKQINAEFDMCDGNLKNVPM